MIDDPRLIQMTAEVGMYLRQLTEATEGPVDLDFWSGRRAELTRAVSAATEARDEHALLLAFADFDDFWALVHSVLAGLSLSLALRVMETEDRDEVIKRAAAESYVFSRLRMNRLAAQ